jgi:hypothetical protein
MNANSQKRASRRSPAPLVDMIGAAERRIHDYLLHHHLTHWHPISTAPSNHDLELTVLDGAAAAILPFPCRRTNSGEWINADLGISIHIQPAKWRPWGRPKTR